MIAIISTPIVLNVIGNAKEKANMNSAYGLIDAGRLYYYESLLNEEKANKIKNVINLWDEIKVSGNKPKNGELYVNESGNIALSIIIDEVCYQKTFTSELSKLKEEECGLGYVGPDTTAPAITFQVLDNPFNENNWAKEDFYVKIEIRDTESGVESFTWCQGTSETCKPVTNVVGDSATILIQTETSSNKICVIGTDKNGNESQIICSDAYKLDKTKPNLTGIGDQTVSRNENVDLINGVISSDTLSGLDGTFTYDPSSVDASKSGITNITYAVMDLAGNRQEYIRKIIVETGSPTVTFTPEVGKINENGWAKSNFLVTITANDQSGHGIKEYKWCSTTSNSCDPSENSPQTGSSGAVSITTESASNRICLIAVDNTGKTSTNICSDTYKLDKTAPSIQGTANTIAFMYHSIDLTSGISVVDSLSGLEGSFTYQPTSINMSVEGTTTIVYGAKDKAGNEVIVIRNISVKQPFGFDDATKTITSYDSSAPKDVVIPSNIDGVAVEKIGDDAFHNNKLTSVTIPNGVTSIGYNAFYGNRLTSVTIPNSVASIRDSAFSYNQLISVTIPNSVKIIGPTAFANNQLTSVTIPNNVRSIGGGAFYLNQLTTVTIPATVMVIEDGSFYDNKLTSVKIIGKTSSSQFTTYGVNLWGWASGYSNSNIIWNASS